MITCREDQTGASKHGQCPLHPVRPEGWHALLLLLFLCLTLHAPAGDLEDLREMIRQMEARHQRELQAVRDEHARQIKGVEERYGRKVEELTERIRQLEEESRGTGPIRVEPEADGQVEHRPAESPATGQSPDTASSAPQQNDSGTIADLGDRLAILEADMAIRQGQQDLILRQLQDRVELHIYGTLEYRDLEQVPSRLDLRNLAVVASAEFVDRLKMMSIAELEPAADGDYEAEIDQAWLEYRISDYFSPRFGLVLAPFGRFNTYHFDILNELSSRPILTQTIVPVSWTEPAIGFAGSAWLDSLGLEQWSVDYEAYMVNGLKDQISDQGMVGANDIPHQENNNNKAFVGRLGLRMGPNQEIGISGYQGDYDSAGNAATGLDLDWRFRCGPAELLGEYAVFWIDEGLNADGETTPDRMAGGYVQLNYHFWPDVLSQTFLGDRFESPKLTLAARFDHVEITDDGDAGDGDNREQRLTLGINYRPVESWAFKLEYQWNETKNEPLDQGNADGVIFSVTTSL